MKLSVRTIRGGTRLAFDGVEGVTNTVESMHQKIAGQAQPWRHLTTVTRDSPAHGIIADAVYRSIRGINGALRTGVERSFELAPLPTGQTPGAAAEIRLVAALNGALGDHLAASGNTLAIDMGLTTPAITLPIDPEALATACPRASPHLLVMVHGLGMSELSWSRNATPCIGSALQDATGATPLYLRYNTGRHISTNGRELAGQLQSLLDAWPVPVQSLSLIGHSMGGLVIRSACWYAQEAGCPWLGALAKVVCLGTPHHGAPLAKMAHLLDRTLRRIPYTEPFTFSSRRSAGIRDLRHGSLRDEDWLEDHPGRTSDAADRTVPLLPGVDYYFAAASVGRDRHDPMGQLLGDLLVRPESATGSHRDTVRSLNVRPENCRVFHQQHHLDLLDDHRVQRQVIDWFSDSNNSVCLS